MISLSARDAGNRNFDGQPLRFTLDDDPDGQLMGKLRAKRWNNEKFE